MNNSLMYTSVVLEERILKEVNDSKLNLQLYLQWRKIHGFFQPSKEVASLPLNQRISTVILRQYQNCFHNLMCLLRTTALQNAGHSATCTELYTELLDIDLYVTELEKLPRVVGSQLDSDIIVHIGLNEIREEIKTTLGTWSDVRKDALQKDDCKMIFIDLNNLPSELDYDDVITIKSVQGVIRDIVKDAQDLMRRIKAVLPAVAHPTEVILPGVRLEEELDEQALDHWYDILIEKFHLPNWRSVLKVGDNCLKYAKETEKLLLEAKPLESEFAFSLEENSPEVWAALTKRLEPTHERVDKKCGGAYFMYWDHETTELAFEERGNPTNFYHEMQDPDIKRKGKVGLTVTEADYQFNPGLRELHYSGMYKRTDKTPSLSMKNNAWWSHQEVDEAKYCADYWKSHCYVPIAKGILQELISGSEWEELPDCAASSSLCNWIERMSKSKMMSLLWLNSIIARIIASHKYIGGVNLRKERVGPGSYIYWTGKKSTDSISVARGTFVEKLPPKISTVLSRDVMVFECCGGFFIWESWRRVQVSDLEAWLSFPKTIVAITTMTIEAVSPDDKIPNQEHLMEDWVYLCFLFLATKDQTVRNCKPWTAIVASIDNDYLSRKTMIESVPNNLPSKIEVVFWSKLYHWFSDYGKTIKVSEKTIVLDQGTSRVDFDEPYYPPIFIRCCRTDHTVGRIIQSRLGMILNRTLKSTLSVKQRLAGKYAKMSLQETSLDEELGLSVSRLHMPVITSAAHWVNLILLEMQVASNTFKDYDARVCSLTRRPAIFLLLGAIWAIKDKEKLKMCHKNLGVYEGMTQPITKGLRNSAGITRGNPRSMHQAALTLLELELDPTSYIRSQFVNNIAREAPTYVSSKINQKEGERFKKEREFQSERQIDYELNNLMNLLPRAVKTNIITNNQDKTLQQQQMYDNVLSDAARAKKKYKDIVPIMAVSDIKQWSPRKDDSELVWFLVPVCALMNSSEVTYRIPKICKASLCSVMQTLERKSHHGIIIHNKLGNFDWLETSSGDHLQDKIAYRLAIMKNEDIFDKQVSTRFSSTMGKTHPVATQMQDVKYTLMMRWALKLTNTSILSNIRCLTSADDIVVCFVAMNNINAIDVCRRWTDLALIFGAEEVSADKTYLSKAGRGEFLGAPTNGFKFIPEKLTSSAGHVGLSSFDPSLGCALSSLMGACQRAQLTGLSTAASFCTLLIGKAWLTWALDLAERSGSLWSELKDYLVLDLPSGFKVPSITFADFASGQTLSELELSIGSNMYREYYSYIGALDTDFVVVPYNPSLKADLPKLSALNGLNIPTPRSRQPQTEIVVTRFVQTYGTLSPYTDMEGIDLAFSRGDSIEDIGFAASLPSLLSTRGLYRRSDKLDLIGSYFRLRMGKCVKLRQGKVTMKEAYRTYIERTRLSDAASNATVCSRILDHVFPEHLDKQRIADCTVTANWVPNRNLKLIKISTPPRLFRCSPDEISFFITYGAALCQIIKPRGAFKDLVTDAKRVLRDYPQAPSLGHSILSSLITPPIPPPFVACSTEIKLRFTYHTALHFASLDNVWGGYGVARDDSIVLGKMRKGYEELEAVAQEVAAKFILTACTGCPLRGTPTEYLSRLESASIRGVPVNMAITKSSQYCTLLTQLLHNLTISSSHAKYRLPYDYMCSVRQELITWAEEETYLYLDPSIYTKLNTSLSCADGYITFQHPLFIRGTYRFCNAAMVEIVKVIGHKKIHSAGGGYAWQDDKKKLYLSNVQSISPDKITLVVTSEEDEALKLVEPGKLCTTTFYVELSFNTHIQEVMFDDRIVQAMVNTNVFDLRAPKGDLETWSKLFPDARPQTLLRASYYLSLLSGTGSKVDLTQLAEGSLWIPSDPSNIIAYLHTPGSVLSMALMKDTIQYMELLSTEDLKDGVIMGILQLIRLSSKRWLLGKTAISSIRDKAEKKVTKNIEFAWRVTVACALTYRKRTGIGIHEIKQLILERARIVLARASNEENELPFSLQIIASEIGDIEWVRLTGNITEILNTTTDYEHFLEIEGIKGASFIPNLQGTTYLSNKNSIWWADELYYMVMQIQPDVEGEEWDEDEAWEQEELPSWAQSGQ